MKSTRSFIKIGISLPVICFFSTNVMSLPAQAQVQNHSSTGAKYADDSLIITTSPGADMNKIKALLTDVHATVIRTLHVNRENYSLLFVKPEKGKADETLKNILAKKDKNIQSVGRNGVYRAGSQ